MADIRTFALAVEAHRMLDWLHFSPQDMLAGPGGLREVERRARRAEADLLDAAIRATNHTETEPDRPGAHRWCGWCGCSDPDQIVDDGMAQVGMMDSPPEWRCRDLEPCLARRRERYPDRQTKELIAATREAAYWRDEASCAVAALTAWALAPVALSRQQEARQRAARAAPRPGGQWSHVMSGNPANRAWTLGARRQMFGHGR